MCITFKDLIKLWGEPANQKEIDLNVAVGRISTDSRTIEKGDFFVPLVGNKFDAHDEKNEYKDGDKVSIMESRPISKKKSWTVLSEAKK